jgi:mannose-6-phosphate isomerase-like protein (cupin superfamily)
MHALAPEIDQSLYQTRKESAAETVYEITTQRNNLPFGIAIADIEQSVPHFHRATIETYTIVQGAVELTLDDRRITLEVGDMARIDPFIVHSARSLGPEAARLTVTCIPEWSADDYHATD